MPSCSTCFSWLGCSTGIRGITNKDRSWLASLSRSILVRCVATWRDNYYDSYHSHCQFDNRLQLFRDIYDDTYAAGGGGFFDLLFEAGQEQGLDSLGAADAGLK